MRATGHSGARRLTPLLVAVLFVVPSLANAEPGTGSKDLSLRRLAEMSLEDLVNLEISTVSKRSERRQLAAAAVHVITAEDIRRSPATNIPGLLRMVPGLLVAQIDANKTSQEKKRSAHDFLGIHEAGVGM